MPQLYSKDSTNPYGYKGLNGEAPGRHTVSRYDRYTVAERNRNEEIITELRNQLTVQIDDSTQLRDDITYRVFVPQTRTSVVNSSYIPFEFRGIGLYEPAYSLDGPIQHRYDGHISQVIVHRKTPGEDGTTIIDVKIDGTSVLNELIALEPTDTTAVVYTDFTSSYFNAYTSLTVDIVDAESYAEDLLVIVEVAYPFQNDIFTGEYVQYGVPYVVENLDGIWICPFECEFKYFQCMADSTAPGFYDITLHHIDSTYAFSTNFSAPGAGGVSIAPDYKVNPGDMFSVSIDGVPSTTDDMNLRIALTFDRRILNYKSIMNFIGGAYYEAAEAWDVPRYIPETILIHDVYLTRGINGYDGSTVVILKDDGVEITRLSIDSTVSYYDAASCHTQPGVTVAGGSYLTFDILEVDKGNPSDLRCMVVYEKEIPTDPIRYADSTETLELRSSIVRMDSTVAETSVVVGNLDSTVANILITVADLDSTSTNLLAEIARLDSTVAEVAADVVLLDATVSEIRIEQTANNVSTLALAASVDALDSTSYNLLTRMNVLDSTVAEVAAGFAAIDSTVSEMSIRISNLDSTIGENTAAITSLEDVVADMTSEVRSVVIKTGNYVITSSDHTILCNALGGGFSLALPPVGGTIGRIYKVKKIDDSTNTIGFNGDGVDQIDGVEAGYSLDTPKQAIEVVSDSTQWWITSLYTPA